MSVNTQRDHYTSSPPEVDEGYWRALLREDNAARPVQNNSYVYQFTDEPERDNSGEGTGERRSDWEVIREMMEQDEALELAITGFNRGGLLVEWRSLRGFVPASQLIEFPNVPNPQMRQRALAMRVGETLVLRVIELNQEQNRLILSERAARSLPGERADLLTRIQSGAIVQGTITNLCDFGAFVDLGGLEGLIHISELSWGRVGHPEEMLQRGEVINVYVLDINQDAGRVALSLKRLNPDPWATVHQRYQIGETVRGVITNVVDFGAFARIEDGLEGLIHVSELAEGHFLHPRNVVSEGQEIHARILSIDGRARRLGLTLRAARP
jgi:small subunit ribosomal protein S1